MFTDILLCTDGSEHALHAARIAGELAAQFNSRLRVLHVLSPSQFCAPPLGAWEIAIPPDAQMEWARDVQKDILTRTAAVLNAFARPFTVLAEMGHPSEVIVERAKAEPTDLIVVGSRGMGGVKSLLLGSVSSAVLHHAVCPVLVVK